jgi:hypothetical protein
MPSLIDVPEYYQPYSIEDVNKYNQLPFYLAAMEARMFPVWDTYGALWGKMNWSPNMGPTLKGVQAQHTPVIRQEFYPKRISETPNKDVYETYETTEQTSLYWQDFDSKQINFLPNFQDFRTNQIDFTHKDIVRQISVASEMFTRSVMVQKTPFLYVIGDNTAGATTDLRSDVPYIPAGTDITQATVDAAGKNTAFWLAMINKVGRVGISMSDVDRLMSTLRDDLRAPFFEGAANSPKENELIKGKYVMVGSSEAFQNFKWDPDLAKFRNVDWNIVTEGFAGSIFGMVTYKTEHYPMRITATGTRPAPETYDNTTKRTIPNPDYVNAPYEVAWILGADAFKTIKVGPPPKAFASGTMNAEDFIKMNWNGEVKLTKNFLIAYSADGGATLTYDTNNRGRFVKFISSVVYGCLAVNARNAIPILFKRGRPNSLVA